MKDPLAKYNDPRLYIIAKQVTLDAGFPYTDPRTGETTQPSTRKKTMNTGKKPKWILLDQLHIDINIKSDIPAKERKALIKHIRDNQPSLEGAIKAMLTPTSTVWQNIRVKITK